MGCTLRLLLASFFGLTGLLRLPRSFGLLLSVFLLLFRLGFFLSFLGLALLSLGLFLCPLFFSLPPGLFPLSLDFCFGLLGVSGESTNLSSCTTGFFFRLLSLLFAGFLFGLFRLGYLLGLFLSFCFFCSPLRLLLFFLLPSLLFLLAFFLRLCFLLLFLLFSCF